MIVSWVMQGLCIDPFDGTEVKPQVLVLSAVEGLGWEVEGLTE